MWADVPWQRRQQVAWKISRKKQASAGEKKKAPSPTRKDQRFLGIN